MMEHRKQNGTFSLSKTAFLPSSSLLSPSSSRLMNTSTTSKSPLRRQRQRQLSYNNNNNNNNNSNITVMHVEQIHTGELNTRDVLKRTKNNNDAAPVLVLSFVTSNCRACNYAQVGFKRLAREFSTLRTHRGARFYEVNVSDIKNQRLGQRLGVTAVPSFQLYAYKQEGRKEEQVVKDNNKHNKKGAFGVLDELVGARVVGKVRDRLLHYCSDSFDLDDYVFDDGV